MKAIADPMTSALAAAKAAVDELVPDLAAGEDGRELSKAGLQEKLAPLLFAVLATGRSLSLSQLSEQHAADLWHIICKLWVSPAAVLAVAIPCHSTGDIITRP
jgi:hypothetical protein